MRSIRLWSFAIALAFSGCSAGYDCRSKAVHDKLFSILRDNFYDVLGKADEPSLRGIAAVAGVAGFVAGVAEMANEQDANPKLDRSILEQLRAFPQTARFSLNSLTEEDGERDRNKHSCRASVHIEATIPDKFADSLRQLPFLGVNAKGEVAGDIDVRFTTQPDLSGKSDFVVRATW
jgi:hypothetical protein